MSSLKTVINSELPPPPEEGWWSRRRWARWPIQFAFREERFFLILSVFIGIFSALAVVCFRLAIDFIRLALMGPHLTPSGTKVILATALTGLVIAVLVLHVFPDVRGSGVNQTKAALYIYNGYIPFRTAIGKFITASLAIGSGYSLGPEDPSLQIGASLASMLELPSLEEQREEAILRVEDAMQPPAGHVLDAEETVEHAYRIVEQSTDGFFLVRHSPSGWSSVTKDLIGRLQGEGKGNLTLGPSLPTQRLPILHPDLPLEVALRYVHSSPILPVVHRADFRKLEGVIFQQDVLNCYQLVEHED